MKFDFGDDWEQLSPDEKRERLAKAPRPDDDLPVPITVRQAAAVARLVGAAISGHDVRQALIDVQRALVLSVSIASHGPGVMAGDAVEVWQRVEAWPSPPPGGPRGQPL